MLNLEERVCTELWVVVVVLCSLLYFINDRFLIVWFVLLVVFAKHRTELFEV